MKKLLLISFVILLFACGAEEGANHSDSGPQKSYPTKKKLQKRYDELVALDKNLERKKEEVSTLYDNFSSDIEELEDEIRTVVNKNNLNDFNQMLKETRIRYNLELLQQKRAYLKKLTSFYKQLMLGNEEILFLKRKTKSDLQVAQVLDEKEMKDLIQQIEATLNKNLPYADQLAIEVSPQDLESKEQILQNILNTQSEESQAEEETEQEEPVSNSRIIDLINKGQMDIDWYFNQQDNAFYLESEKIEEVEAYSNAKKLLLAAEKIIFLNQCIILGMTYENADDINPEAVLLDKYGVKHPPIMILWDDGHLPVHRFFQPTVTTTKGEIKRVFYVFNPDDPEKFTCGALSCDRFTCGAKINFCFKNQ